MNRRNEIKLTLGGPIANEIDDSHFKRNPGPFIIVATCLARTATGCLLEAVVEANLTTSNHGFQRISFLSDCRGLVKAFNNRKASKWQDTTRLADLIFLVQDGLLCKMILIPPLLVNSICVVAKQATLVPLNQYWFNPVCFVNA